MRTSSYIILYANHYIATKQFERVKYKNEAQTVAYPYIDKQQQI
jgi:hypothetical protein